MTMKRGMLQIVALNAWELQVKDRNLWKKKKIFWYQIFLCELF